MITPPSLKTGDTVGLVAPARKVRPEEVGPAMRLLESWGLKVKCGEHLYASDRQFAGTDEERASDLQRMLDDPLVKAVWCARGGYGVIRLIDVIDFTAFVNRPKWMVGYSDITVLHSHIHENFGIETLHATMPVNIPIDCGDLMSLPALASLRRALFGQKLVHAAPASPLNRPGKASGRLVGGNLSILYSLLDSASAVSTTGKILFLEDLEEYLYHVDRMMISLKRAGLLTGLQGLVVGGMSGMNDNKIPFGRTANEIIAEAVASFHYPVCFDFPAGHVENNMALILGRTSALEVGDHVTLVN